MKVGTIGFIGAGRAATGLAGALAAHGCDVVVVASKSRASAERLASLVRRMAVPLSKGSVPGRPGRASCPPAVPVWVWADPDPGDHRGSCAASDAQGVADAADLVFIATPDAEIAGVVESVAWRAGQAVVHLSGASTLEPLEAARQAGARAGSFHPVQTFPAPSREPSIDELRGLTRDVAFGIEADGDDLFDELAGLATRLGGFPLRVDPEHRALYHAGAVMACGLLAALFEEAVAVWGRAGLPRETAARALWRLADATLDNVRAQGATAITGPMVRGDFATVQRHLDALRASAPGALAVYEALSARMAILTQGREQ